MPRLAHAQGHPDARDRHYIFCYFGGGWDTLLGLDPRDPAVFTNENLRTTRIQPGYELLESSDGFLVEAPNGMIFGPHIGDLCGVPWINAKDRMHPPLNGGDMAQCTGAKVLVTLCGAVARGMGYADKGNVLALWK